MSNTKVLTPQLLAMYLGQKAMQRTFMDDGKWCEPFEVDIDHISIELAMTDPDHYETKPILRPLSKMTEAEASKYEAVWHEGEACTKFMAETCEAPEAKVSFEHMAAITQRLCADGFDLFGLLPANLAIEKTK